jgi:phosphatidate phosphatase APP1
VPVRTYGGVVGARRWIVSLERAWDAAGLRRAGSRPPAHFRIETYIGHGGPEGVVVRGRVLDDPPPSEAIEGEGVGAALRRTVRGFLTDELPGVPLRVTGAGASVETVTDDEGYFHTTLHPDPEGLASPWTRGSVELVEAYRGLTGAHTTALDVRVPGPEARFGVLSDIDDTILETGVQRVGAMLRQTFTGSALTRTPFPGAAVLYRDLAADGDEENPVFYVSSSPWNLHTFLLGFLRHRDFPLGPVLLRDLIGNPDGRARKHERIEEVLRLHPQLPFVLIGDSGERDPEVYADIVRAHPGRVLAVYIREVRLDPGDGRVEKVTDAWDADVPFVLAADSDAVRRHAESIGLLRSRAAGS